MDTEVVVKGKVEEVTVRTGKALRSRYSLWILAGVSFVESALPVPMVTDPFLMAYILADKTKTKRAIFVTTAASLIGGLFAYALAYAFFDMVVAQYLTGTIAEQFNEIVTEFNKGTFWITVAGAVTPVPYTTVAVAAGFLKAGLLTFLLASLVGRGGRYILVGALTYRFGEQAISIIKRHLLLVTITFTFALIVYLLTHFL